MHVLKLLGLYLVCLGGTAIAIGCGDSGGSDHDHADHADACHGEGCSADTDAGDQVADQYVAGLEKVTESELFTVKLVKSEPIPKYVDKYVWTLQLLDADKKPVTGAKLEAEARMPQHAHGTFPPVSFATESDEKGTYVVEKMDLFMSGVWQIHVRFTIDKKTHEVFYNFDLEG